jgi:hypothetical protein
MRWDNDLAPFKPATDVHVAGHARAPRSLPATTWRAGVRVGNVSKLVQVTGPREWRLVAGMVWELDPPAPALEVPLRYEFAFGGEARTSRKHVACDRNPVGVGFHGGIGTGEARKVPAPQFEELGKPIQDLDGDYAPQGFGPSAPAWLPRRARCGTYDEKWLRERWPLVPDDFDFGFYNSADPELVAKPYLRGDERVELEGFHHDGPVRSSLPGIRPFLLLRLVAGPMLPHPMRLDTLVIDVDADQFVLTWRAKVPLEPEVRVIELRAQFPPKAAHG